MYIRHISELNKVNLIYTHAETLIFSSSHNLSELPFTDFTIGDFVAGTTTVTT